MVNTNNHPWWGWGVEGNPDLNCAIFHGVNDSNGVNTSIMATCKLGA